MEASLDEPYLPHPGSPAAVPSSTISFNSYLPRHRGTSSLVCLSSAHLQPWASLQPLHRLSPVSACQPIGFPLPTPSYPRLQALAELTSELGKASHKLHSSWPGVVTWSLAPDHSCLRFQTPLPVFHTWEAAWPQDTQALAAGQRIYNDYSG